MFNESYFSHGDFFFIIIILSCKLFEGVRGLLSLLTLIPFQIQVVDYGYGETPWFSSCYSVLLIEVIPPHPAPVIPSAEHLSLSILSQFIFSYDLLTPSLIKVGFCLFWCHWEWHPPFAQNKQKKFSKRLLLLIRTRVLRLLWRGEKSYQQESLS